MIEELRKAAMSNLKIHMFPALSDNYCFLVQDVPTGKTAVVDTPEVAAIEKALADTGWTLDFILNTHHHFDHAGGNLALKEKTGCKIVGAANDAARIPGIDILLNDGDRFELGNSIAHIIEVPGHTSGHIAYWFREANVAFVGDTLFALGCGRLFEGTPAQMWTSLQKLMVLPDDTTIYCAHEYTQSNARFALTVEPQNQELVRRAAEIDKARAAQQPTVPTNLALEKATNPFLRPLSKDIQLNLDMAGADPVEVFAEIRSRKDRF